MLNKKRVYCETIEADKTGIPPDDPNFDENSKTPLDLIMESDDKVGILTSLGAFQCF